MEKQWYYQNVQYPVINQEVKGLLSNLDLRIPLSKVPLGEILFWVV